MVYQNADAVWFFERYLGVRLYWYQKVVLRTLEVVKDD